MNASNELIQSEPFENLTELSIINSSKSQMIIQATLENVWLFLKNYFITILFIVLVAFAPTIFRNTFLKINLAKNAAIIISDEKKMELIEKIESTTKNIDKKLATKTPSAFYLVINSSSNNFSLYKGTELIKSDRCSTGSYILLKNGSQQEWMFKTPKGEFKIKGKQTDPVWKKPDWAFVEEGLPVPSMNHSSRYEYGVLGDYSLQLGQGYMIHGTLYQRFLGLPVTHGCIRLNDENLKLVFTSLNQGSKVYIY